MSNRRRTAMVEFVLTLTEPRQSWSGSSIRPDCPWMGPWTRGPSRHGSHERDLDPPHRPRPRSHPHGHRGHSIRTALVAADHWSIEPEGRRVHPDNTDASCPSSRSASAPGRSTPSRSAVAWRSMGRARRRAGRPLPFQTAARARPAPRAPSVLGRPIRVRDQRPPDRRPVVVRRERGRQAALDAYRRLPLPGSGGSGVPRPTGCPAGAPGIA